MHTLRFPALAACILTAAVIVACSPDITGRDDAGRDAATAPATPARPVTQTEEVVADYRAQGSASVGQALSYKSAAPATLGLPAVEPERERYAHLNDNPLRLTAEHPVSTFSIDVDTGAYANVRRWLNQGRLPPEDAVRVEELINYFDYAYAPPDEPGRPFAVHTEIARTPWNPNTHLLKIGIKGYDVAADQRKPANLVFLVDVSGSMAAPDKLDLLKPALELLVNRLEARDRIAVAVYAGASGIVLEPTAGNEKARIRAALDGLAAGGSTNGASGIRLAYSLARQSFIEGGINRVLLATDGDFNVGTVNFEELKDLVERERESGIALTTLGFGAGNYNDQLMEQLADAGNGNHAYIDTLNEARKVLVGQMTGTLQTIAKDVKIQVEFNPAAVSEYRLIGYENRVLKREDFSNDRIDAGEIGAGHTVTALYEVSLAGDQQRIPPLRYGQASRADANAAELAFVRMRYKQPDGDDSELVEWPLERALVQDDPAATSDDFRFAAAVAAFGQILRGAKYTEAFGYEQVADLARTARGTDPFGYRGEFLNLVALAEALDTPNQAKAGD